jgi:hypothetical protein
MTSTIQISDNKHVENNECCICLDEISDISNRVITECNHTFHTSCLMKNIAANGFACPCCRSEMAEVKDDEDEDDEDESYEDEDDEDERYALRGLRWFMRRIDENESSIIEQPDSENNDIHDEESDDDSIDEIEDDQEKEDCILTTYGLRIPKPSYIMEKLQGKNITSEELIISLLMNEHDDVYTLNETTFERMNATRNKVYGAFRAIISQFRP